jgi:hypothetical protein
MKKTFLAAPLLVLLEGCASSYVAPVAGTPVARLRIVQVTNDNIRIMKLHDACLTTDKNARHFGKYYDKIGYLGAVGSDLDKRRLAMPTPPAAPARFTEIPVAAGQPFHLGMDATRMVSAAMGAMVYSCVDAMTFTPVAGRDYEAVMQWPNGGQCGFELVQLQAQGGKVARLAVADATPVRSACP